MLGKLIVFEGVEGGGKTTQIARLEQWFIQQWAGELPPILVTKEPGGTLLGQGIRHLLLTDCEIPLHERAELLLYAADRAQHIAQEIHPRLARGELILCDRFTDSTIAYQGYGRGLDLNLIHQLNQIATQGLESDVTFWLDVEVERGLQRAKNRGTSDRMEQATLEFHRRVQQGFRELAQQYPDRIVRIDANQNPDQVQQQIQQALAARWEQWNWKPLSKPFSPS